MTQPGRHGGEGTVFHGWIKNCFQLLAARFGRLQSLADGVAHVSAHFHSVLLLWRKDRGSACALLGLDSLGIRGPDLLETALEVRITWHLERDHRLSALRVEGGGTGFESEAVKDVGSSAHHLHRAARKR